MKLILTIYIGESFSATNRQAVHDKVDAANALVTQLSTQIPDLIQKTEVGVIERFIPGTITKKGLKFVEFETNSKIFSLDQPAYCRYKNNPAGSWPVGIQFKVGDLVLNYRLSTESLYALLCKSDKADWLAQERDLY